MSSDDQARRRRSPAWRLRSQILIANLVLATSIVLTSSAAMFALSYHATYMRAEADLLAAAQELVSHLKDNPNPSRLEVSDLYRHRFGMAPRDHAYLALWNRDGRELYATSGLPKHAISLDRLPATSGPHPFVSRSNGRFLDVIVQTPQQGQLLVGRPLAKEWDALLWLVLRLVGLGALSLLGATILAVWLSNRLSAPLDELARTARRISDRDFSQRLAITGTPSEEVIQLSDALNQLVDRLQSAIERQNRFVANASHELRTPVTVILSQAEHTLHRERDVGTYKDSIGVCLQAARQMKRLTEDLLFLARADSRKLMLCDEVFDLDQVVRLSVELLLPLASVHSVRIEQNLEPVSLHGDREHVGQVVTNLITNAIRYNRPGGLVTVRTMVRDANGIIEVQDDGIGIPEADQAHIFERFFQSDSARTHHAEAGAGLGLSLVYEIVSAHGGSIDLSSIPGTGTTFTVLLPGVTNARIPNSLSESKCE